MLGGKFCFVQETAKSLSLKLSVLKVYIKLDLYCIIVGLVEASKYWMCRLVEKSNLFCSKLRSLITKEPNIGCAAAHPAHPLPNALQEVQSIANMPLLQDLVLIVG